MPIVSVKNPWGQSADYEAQRSDMWLLDLANVLSLVNGHYKNYLDSMPFAQCSYAAFAVSVDFPLRQLAAKEIRRGNQKYQRPGELMPMSPLRITFQRSIHSTLDELLQKWQRICNAGRMERVNHMNANGAAPELSEESVRRILCHSNTNFSGYYGYMVDIPIYLLKGAVQYANDGAQTVANVQAGANQAAVEIASTYMVYNAWISSIQPGGLIREQGLQTLAVELIVDDVQIVESTTAPAQTSTDFTPAPPAEPARFNFVLQQPPNV